MPVQKQSSTKQEFQPVSNKGKFGNNIFSSSICKRQTLAIDFFHPIGNCRFFVPFSSCISTERQLCHVLITLQPWHQIFAIFYQAFGKFQQTCIDNLSFLSTISSIILYFSKIKLVNNLELQKIIYFNVSHPPPSSTNKNKQ